MAHQPNHESNSLPTSAPHAEQPLLSIIVPVYNTGAYLAQCLDSLLQQGFDTESGEYEIICVDDGSTDRSPAILADYARRHPQLISVVTQQNQGPGMARNRGIDHARGEYVCFADSDDQAIEGAYAYIYRHFCQTQRPDIVQYNYLIATPNTPTPHHTLEGEILLNGTIADLYNDNREYQVTNKFYRRERLNHNHIRFPKLTYAEDSIFTLQTARCQGTALKVSTFAYIYQQRNDSIVHTADRQLNLFHMDNLLFFLTLCARQLRQPKSRPIKPGLLVNKNAQLYCFYCKALTCQLTYQEWQHYMGTLRQATAPYDRLTRWLPFPFAPFYDSIRLAYPIYLLNSAFYRHIHLPLRARRHRKD